MEFEDSLLPAIIDERAKREPDRLYCIQITSENVEESVVKITYRNFADSVNKCAWWFDETFGKQDGFPTIAYIGPNDIRYAIFTLAAVKTGYKALLLATANSVPAQINLLNSTNCSHLVVPADFAIYEPAVAAISSQIKLKTYEIEGLAGWLRPPQGPSYDCTAKLSDLPERPFVVMHTSGSTGLPKPLTHLCQSLPAFGRYVAYKDALPGSRRNTSLVWEDVDCLYMCFRTCQIIGLGFLTSLAIYWNVATIVGPPMTFPTPNLVNRIIRLGHGDGAVLPPSIIEAMAGNPEMLEGFGRLKKLVWGGAPFSSIERANAVRSRVEINAAFGSTETGPLPLVYRDQDDFEWMEFSEMVGASFRHHSNDLYELVIVKKPEISHVQFFFLNNPGASEYRTKDLMSEHPTRKGLWKYRGRTDEIVVLSNADNIDPGVMENVIDEDALITGSVLTGNGRPGAAWLLEVKQPPATEEEKEQLIDKIWPSVEKANRVCIITAQVPRSRIVFASADKPLKRSEKGTVHRPSAVEAYRDELAALYAN